MRDAIEVWYHEPGKTYKKSWCVVHGMHELEELENKYNLKFDFTWDDVLDKTNITARPKSDILPHLHHANYCPYKKIVRLSHSQYNVPIN